MRDEETLSARVKVLEQENRELRFHAEDLARRAAESATEQKNFLHAIVNSLETALVACDADGNLTLFNRATRELHGLTDADIPPGDWASYFRLYHGDGITPLTRDEVPLFRALQGETVRNYPVVVTARGAGPRKLLSTGRAIFDGSGKKLGAVAAMHDVTEQLAASVELRKSEDRLRQAQRMEAVGQLAGGVAHDFNNMLAAIRMNAELLLLDDRDAATETGLREIEKAAGRATLLTRQLLAFSRTQIMQVRSVNPNDVIEEMKDMLLRLLVGDIELETFLPDVGFMNVDPAQLGQVILNLVVNARDAIQSKGKICITTENSQLAVAAMKEEMLIVPGEYVIISVSDTGAGMSPAVKNRIFEPFFTTKEKGKGTGLGMATVFGIVAQSGGHIDIDTEEGKGTTFSIYFPRAHAPASVDSDTPEASGDVRGNETILLVDDEDVVRAAIATALRRAGYRVLEANGGNAALGVVKRHQRPIDLVLTDIMMPGMNGDELFVRLAGVQPGIKVLLMSGFTDQQVATRGLLNPTLPFIGKPFTIEDLLVKLRDLLGRFPLAEHAAKSQ